MSKVENHLIKIFDHLVTCPHIEMFGERQERYWKGVVVITKEVDNDDEETYTEMSDNEKKIIKKLVHPFQVRFCGPLMLTYSQWRNGIKCKPNPITGKIFTKF